MNTLTKIHNFNLCFKVKVKVEAEAKVKGLRG